MRIVWTILFFACISISYSSAYITENTSLPPCVPRPYEIKIDVENLPQEMRRPMLDFVDHINHRVIEEIYLRFCQYLDSLMDTTFVSIDSIVDDTIRYVRPSCSLKTEIIYSGSCASTFMYVRSNIVEFVGDTLDLNKAYRNVALRFFEHPDSGSDYVEFVFPEKIDSQYTIEFPQDHETSVNGGVWMFDGGMDKDMSFVLIDFNYIQTGNEAVSGGERQIVYLPQKFINNSYRVFLQWCDSSGAAVGPLSQPNLLTGLQKSDSSFEVILPSSGLSGRFSWYASYEVVDYQYP